MTHLANSDPCKYPCTSNRPTNNTGTIVPASLYRGLKLGLYNGAIVCAFV